MAASRRQEAETAIEKKVKSLVEGIVGAGNARVSVSADVDLASVTRQQEEYNPDGQVLRSTATSEEKTTEGGGGVGGEVSAAENLPGGDAGATTTTTAAANSVMMRTSECGMDVGARPAGASRAAPPGRIGTS